MNELDNLEVFELMQAIYPEKFKDEDDATFEAAIDFFDELLAFGHGRELIAKLVMLTPTITSELTGEEYHALGTISGNTFIAHVRRKAEENNGS